eukprot:6195191-Amphidinium_carterae.1
MSSPAACYRQAGKVKGKLSYSYLKRQECMPQRKTFKQHFNVAPEKVEPLAPLAGVGCTSAVCPGKQVLFSWVCQKANLSFKRWREELAIASFPPAGRPVLHRSSDYRPVGKDY